MGLSRRLKRNNNMAGLKVQLVEKEREVFALSQKADMQQMYLQEMGKISNALKDIMVRELKITDKDVTDMLEKELAASEAEEVDALVKEEEADAPQDEAIDPVALDEPKEVVEPVKAKATKKKPAKAVPPKKELAIKEQKKKDIKDKD